MMPASGTPTEDREVMFWAIAMVLAACASLLGSRPLTPPHAYPVERSARLAYDRLHHNAVHF
jgi:hypothetical protein